MPKIKLSRREWMLFLFPCALLLLSHLDKLGALNSSRLASLNPFVRARENARLSSCQSNLKQISLGLMQYAQDYDGRFPINTTTKGWVYGINPYTKSCPILRCPSEAFSPAVPMIPSYWMNSNLDEKAGRGRGISLKEVDKTDRTYLFGDGDASVAKGNYTQNENSWNVNSSYASRHLFGANYAFVDGHVKWLPVETVDKWKTKAPCCTFYSFKTKVLK